MHIQMSLLAKGVANNTVTSSVRHGDKVNIQIEQKPPSLNKFSAILNELSKSIDIRHGKEHRISTCIDLLHRHSILETNILYRQPIEFKTPQTEEDWLIPSEDVSVGAVIGEGAFGLVCKGTMSGPKGMAVRVAIKQLKVNAIDEEREEFLREMDIMKQASYLKERISRK
uniref:Protein kinase domain-containing protein n=1 Tax=Angiostrongylus cantonensis TaxID=6313 RepID=A0A0K0D5U1_ANGCA